MTEKELFNGIELSVFGLSAAMVKDGWDVGAEYHALAVLSPNWDKLKITIFDGKTTLPLKLDDTENFVFNITPTNDRSMPFYNTGAYNYQPEKKYGGCAFNSYDGYEVYPTIKQLIVDLIKVAEKNR